MTVTLMGQIVKWVRTQKRSNAKSTIGTYNFSEGLLGIELTSEPIYIKTAHHSRYQKILIRHFCTNTFMR